MTKVIDDTVNKTVPSELGFNQHPLKKGSHPFMWGTFSVFFCVTSPSNMNESHLEMRDLGPDNKVLLETTGYCVQPKKLDPSKLEKENTQRLHSVSESEDLLHLDVNQNEQFWRIQNTSMNEHSSPNRC